MDFISNLFKKKTTIADWNRIRLTEEKFPSDGSITLLQIPSENGNFNTGWVNKAYKNYAYKAFCPVCCIITIPHSDDDQDIDMMTIEDYFTEQLNKVCVAHIVSRIVTDDGMGIIIYTETFNEVAKKLPEMYESPSRIVEFGSEIKVDEKWKIAKQLLNV